jgi:hypothetical protein
MASNWKSPSGVPSFSPDTMLLMTDGTVMVHDAGRKAWYRLKPDGNGRHDTAGVAWSGPFCTANRRHADDCLWRIETGSRFTGS